MKLIFGFCHWPARVDVSRRSSSIPVVSNSCVTSSSPIKCSLLWRIIYHYVSPKFNEKKIEPDIYYWLLLIFKIMAERRYSRFLIFCLSLFVQWMHKIVYNQFLNKFKGNLHFLVSFSIRSLLNRPIILNEQFYPRFRIVYRYLLIITLFWASAPRGRSKYWRCCLHNSDILYSKCSSSP